MALQLSNTTKNKGLNNLLRQSPLYVHIPAPEGAPIPRADITFNDANNGQISLAAPVSLMAYGGITVDAVYIHTSPLSSLSNALVKIELTGDDVETYENEGVYIINTINVAINTQ